MSEAYLVGGVRTPQGRYGGALAGIRPDDLAALVVREVVRRAAVPPRAPKPQPQSPPRAQLRKG